jgi:hypothetical protein
MFICPTCATVAEGFADIVQIIVCRHTKRMWTYTSMHACMSVYVQACIYIVDFTISCACEKGGPGGRSPLVGVRGRSPREKFLKNPL